MTILPWPGGGKPSRPGKPRKRIVDPLPRSVLHTLVSGLPGPKDETETARAARFEAQLAEVLAFQPRDSAEAMLATQCVLLRLVAEDAHRDAARPGLPPAVEKKYLKAARELDRLILDMKKTLSQRQREPLGDMDPATFEALGLSAFLIPDPDDPEQAEAAHSAVIVPLHPAPRMLQ